MTVEFGFGLITCQRYPGDPRSDQDLYRQALALAENADASGFDSVWVSEHRFVDDAYLPSLLPMCAAIAARTGGSGSAPRCCWRRSTSLSGWPRTPPWWI